MDLCRKLPEPPAIGLTEVQDRAPGGPDFLGLSRVVACCTYPDGTTSEPFRYDIVTRVALDAVVIVPTFHHEGELYVVLRSAHRVPLALRSPALGNLWELPAGLVEPGESVEEAGARELAEEIGARVAAKDLRPLGPPVAPAPGALAEVQHFVRAEIDPSVRGVPEEDGSPLERHAHLVALPLSIALRQLVLAGLVDGKTELALRRLAEVT